MVREPLQSLQSLYRHFQRTREELVRYTLSIILNGGRPSSQAIADQCQTIRLEDLHLSSRRVMESVAAWLELSWDDCLLSSTFQGLQWWSDGAAGTITGFVDRKAPEQMDRQLIPLFDEFRLKLLLAPKYQIWNYELSAWQRNVFLRMMILPLLAIPFAIEYKGSSLLRSKRLSNADQAWQQQSFLGALKIALWFVGIGYIRDWLVTRRYLLSSWVRMWQSNRPEIPLLDCSHQVGGNLVR